MQRSTEEKQEIERHKYFMSEKRGYDVGWKTAEEDWEQNFAAHWRSNGQAADTSHGAGGTNGSEAVTQLASVSTSAMPVAQMAEAPQAERTVMGKPDSVSDSVHYADEPAHSAPSTGTLRSWLTRLFVK